MTKNNGTQRAAGDTAAQSAAETPSIVPGDDQRNETQASEETQAPKALTDDEVVAHVRELMAAGNEVEDMGEMSPPLGATDDQYFAAIELVEKELLAKKNADDAAKKLEQAKRADGEAAFTVVTPVRCNGKDYEPGALIILKRSVAEQMPWAVKRADDGSSPGGASPAGLGGVQN